MLEALRAVEVRSRSKRGSAHPPLDIVRAGAGDLVQAPTKQAQPPAHQVSGRSRETAVNNRQGCSSHRAQFTSDDSLRRVTLNSELLVLPGSPGQILRKRAVCR